MAAIPDKANLPFGAEPPKCRYDAAGTYSCVGSSTMDGGRAASSQVKAAAAAPHALKGADGRADADRQRHYRGVPGALFA
jgi:hypothetical protein